MRLQNPQPKHRFLSHFTYVYGIMPFPVPL
jgi:hypothetical protein